MKVCLCFAAGSACVSQANPAEGPCDILGAAGNPCFAAHSTIRALYAKYDGPLYTVRNKHGKSAQIKPLKPGGFANAKEHEALCPREGDCVISHVIDQSGHGNTLGVRDDRQMVQKSGNLGKLHKLVDATKHKIFVGDNIPVYGMYFDPGYGYHCNKTKGVAKGNEPETMYAVMTGKRFGNSCCFDYGNSEADEKSDGAGTMEAIYFGNARWRPIEEPVVPHRKETPNSGYAEPGCTLAPASPFQDPGENRSICDGTADSNNCCGPWVGADLEFGMYYGGGNVSTYNAQNKPLRHDFVSLMLKGRTDSFALKGGDATRGSLSTMYDGPRPPPIPPFPRWPKGGKYQPMNKKGAIILATGGDQSNSARGNFYEGFMASGATTDATDEAVQANIASVKYKMRAYLAVV